MSSSKQVDNGNRDEASLAKLFKSKGYWAHIFARSRSGSQPVDAIAFRGSSIWLVDSKNVESGKASFSFDRIEANQRTSLDYAVIKCGLDPKHAGFAVFFERDIDNPRFITYEEVKRIEGEGGKSCNMSLMPLLSDCI